jgi:hypothetical protein
MIKLFPNSKIYVAAPANFHTGGVELAHQFVDILRNKNSNCFIVYFWKNSPINAKIRDEYQKYNIETCLQIEDKPENILIVPEVYSYLLKKYQSIQIGFWWMSVDNYFKSSAIYKESFSFFLRKNWRLIYNHIIDYYIKGTPPLSSSLSYIKSEKERVMHFYQSTYAKDFLLKNNITNILPLSDYINTDLINKDPIIGKEDIILYNPSKGLEFTQKIINEIPEYNFVGLKGFNRDELNIYFKKAKLYIDFGDHPGKDRLPREAAINDCCIITGKNGAARYFEDVPIYDAYKFDKKKKKIPKIKEKIAYIMNHYDECSSDFLFYKQRILNEKKKFIDEAEEFFLH